MIFRMVHYVTITQDGLYHIQNYIMGKAGQHHVHTKKGFQNWKKNVNKEDIKISKGSCNCGLNIGYVKEYDGHIWHSKNFKEE